MSDFIITQIETKLLKRCLSLRGREGYFKQMRAAAKLLNNEIQKSK